MWTRHGHQISGTAISPDLPDGVVNCGGPLLCSQCATDAGSGVAIATAFKEKKTEQQESIIFVKVAQALYDSGLNFNQTMKAIRQMQGAGILFRELR
jgi:hypothetical protein